MNLLSPVFLLGILLLSAPVRADIFKCTDTAGHITYTNEKPASGKARDCTMMTREQPVTSIAPQKRVTPPSPASFPRVDGNTQRARDNDRRQILLNELEAERKLLAEATKAAAEQEAVRLGDERNYQKYLDRIQPFKDKVALHERNIEALNKEISRLR